MQINRRLCSACMYLVFFVKCFIAAHTHRFPDETENRGVGPKMHAIRGTSGGLLTVKLLHCRREIRAWAAGRCAAPTQVCLSAAFHFFQFWRNLLRALPLR